MKLKFRPKSTTPLDHKRDAYGFIVRPQHVQTYREYANIYKEEEEERSTRWKYFLERVFEASTVGESSVEVGHEKDGFRTSEADIVRQAPDNQLQERIDSIHTPISVGLIENGIEELEALGVEDKKLHEVHTSSDIRSTLHAVEDMMSARVKKRTNTLRKGQETDAIEDIRHVKGTVDDDSEEEFYDVERSDSVHDVPFTDSTVSSTAGSTCDGTNVECCSPWKDELDVLVRGGLPMALRGKLWQAFVGVKARRIEKYYQGLLSQESNHNEKITQEFVDESGEENVVTREKWKGQIEKDLPRTFPGHPALDGDGRNALRRVLIAYARHNPSVGYCQAMNFFAGLLLLLMPEENAFWTLMGIMDDYFDGYYTEEMIECQVDQHVFEDLVRERFPKLVNHLDYLGVQVAWLTGPWFLSIFMNILPWESVLRVWDVLLFEGNRVMLFRTALALMELYGPALVTTKDAGDAVTLLQSLAGSTFDSSQLVFTACMGYQNVNEARLEVLRNKHRASVISAINERSKGLQDLKNSQGLASKIGNFKHDPRLVLSKNSRVSDEQLNDDGSLLDSGSTTSDDCLLSVNGGVDVDPGQDLQEQVMWLKDELCKLLEEKRSAELRSEELETALMEMVKQDNRRQLSARVEQLEQEVLELHHALSGKQEQEHVMLQVLMRVEQEQKVTEDARRFAEQEAIAQKESAQVLQEKYEKVVTSLAEMEKRVVMAESMLEATLQYQSGQLKTQPSPRTEPSTESSSRKISLLARPFGLGWLDKSKGQPMIAEESSDRKPNVCADAESPHIQQENGVDCPVVEK